MKSQVNTIIIVRIKKIVSFKLVEIEIIILVWYETIKITRSSQTVDAVVKRNPRWNISDYISTRCTEWRNLTQCLFHYSISLTFQTGIIGDLVYQRIRRGSRFPDEIRDRSGTWSRGTSRDSLSSLDHVLPDNTCFPCWHFDFYAKYLLLVSASL